MYAKKIFYLFYRIHELGIFGLTKVLKRRTIAKVWHWRMRNKALRHQAHHSWEKLEQKYNVELKTFLSNIKDDFYIYTILQDAQFLELLPPSYTDNNQLLSHANQAAGHTFNLLGSGYVSLGKTINWHGDFKKNNLSNPFTKADANFSYETYAHTFHTEIPIPQQETDFITYHEDIKVIWDIGRMQHLTLLGLAFSESENKYFFDVFTNDLNSFTKQVNYLLGPQWKCPMDVAIRAINLIWSFHFFKKNLDKDFLKKYICLLYDHLEYLSWNMEESDKPNNHLLADHVGQLYLAVFFRSLPSGIKRLDKTINELEKAFRQQILSDGTSYEGSTAYHSLDCELLLHATTLLRAIKIPHTKLESLLDKMLDFRAACTTKTGALLTIGDDDGGKIVFGINTQPSSERLKIFSDFGIAIARTPHMHVTLRAAPKIAKRPTGHYHQDSLSITLTVNEHPVFIDPGSFVYSANTEWRRFFKAPQQHSTFYAEEYQENHIDLFQTTLPYKTGTLSTSPGQITTTAVTKNGELLLRRTLKYSNKEITLLDEVLPKKPRSITWRYILHPTIQTQKTEAGFLFFVNSQCIASFTSSLHFQLTENSAYAGAYGHFLPTQALESTQSKSQETTHTSNITVF